MALSSSLLSPGSGSISSLPSSLGAVAIYGQLVTFDQLSQLERHHHSQQQRKQPPPPQQQQAVMGSKAGVVTTNHTTPPSQSPNSASLNVMSASAYANLDPSYSLKMKLPAAAVSQQQQQQQPMEVVETAMELSSSSGSRPGSGSTCCLASNASVNNTYSYPTFPYCTGAATATANSGSAMTSINTVVTSASVAIPSAGDAMAAFRRPSHQIPPQRLLVRMSVRLIQTYETINEVSYGRCLC